MQKRVSHGETVRVGSSVNISCVHEVKTPSGLHGGGVASTVASQPEGRGFNSRCEAACSPHGSRVPSGFSGFLPQSKDMQQVH